eukprot:TRINITY_DN6800_c0_g1_i1.p1 TRINITY_DN6800_c0_g1~~TRINITY_DN6800_c0_g1_i1.p1  ORF type:complete len:269 (-),score=89.20 TRINITY_DN6800_c0_g1_i1:16-822(-)
MENSKISSISSRRRKRNDEDEEEFFSSGTSSLDCPQHSDAEVPSSQEEFVSSSQKEHKFVQCDGCTMIYRPGIPSEESNHRVYHDKLGKRRHYVDFRGWKEENVLKRFDDGRVISISSEDPKRKSKKIEEIVEIMDEELGYVPSVGAKEEVVFIYVNRNKKIIACAIAEPIHEAFPVVDSKQGEEDSTIRCSKEKTSAICGISRIWVHPNERRKGVASRILDLVRAHFIYGLSISKEKLAFTQPTLDGKQLFSHYSGSVNFLVYNPVN